MSSESAGRIHDWDIETHYCMRCGIARSDAIDNVILRCAAADNVTGISHIIKGRAMRKALGVQR